MKTVAEVLRGAVTVLDERGWCQGDYGEIGGSVCALGAINFTIYHEAFPGELGADGPLRWSAINALEKHLSTALSCPAYEGESVAKWNDRPGRTAEVQFGSARGPDKVSGFVNPYTGAVLGRIDDATRPMRILHDLHGTLLAGTAGSVVIELAASWAFVLIVSGFYLWWPRPFTVRGFLLPRLGDGRRALLRDLHAVPAVWLSVFTLFLLATGLQWTPVGGKWARTLAQAAGEWQPRETSASAHRSELLGGWSPYLNSKAKAEQAAAVASTPPSADPHAEHRAKARAWQDDPQRISLARVVAIAAERGVTDPYAIALPQGPAGVYSVITDRNLAFSRVYLHLDQYSGQVLADIRYKDFGAMGKFYTFGIIAHEGQLFGLANQLLGLLTCLGIIGLAVTGVAMWWSRRPKGELAAPASSGLLRVSKGAVVIAVLLSALLPLMAASLVVLLGLDFFLNRRLKFLQSPV